MSGLSATNVTTRLSRLRQQLMRADQPPAPASPPERRFDAAARYFVPSAAP